MEELSEFLEIDIEEISASLSMNSRHLSVDSPLADGEESTLVDVLANPNADLADEKIGHIDSMRQEIDRSLNALTDRQQEVLRLFFGIGVDHPISLEDIGERFGLTRERVRQIKDKAITKLRTTSRSKTLKTYMGT